MSDPKTQPESVQQRIGELENLLVTISRGKRLWEHTFDVILDPVVIIDKNYQIRRSNVALAKACDLDVKNVIGQKCYEIFAGYTAPCPKCPVQQTLADAQPHNQELDTFPKKRRQYTVNVYKLPIQDADSEEIVLHYRDVTDERRLQRQLTQTDKMAAIGTLAGGIAHEINNPLGAILAFTQLTIRELAESDPCMENLKEIEDATLRCKKIVRDVLDFSRQNFEEKMGSIRVNDAIEKALALITVNARHSDIEIRRELDAELPEAFGHFHKLQQVVLNLVTNAMHAMKSTGGVMTIATRPSADQRSVEILVSDTGVGIDAADLNKIFDPFFTTKEPGEGTGLGLSITYGIVKEHQGRIAVESEKGKGTTFTVTLPLAGDVLN